MIRQMSKAVQSFLYVVGFSAVGGALFYAVTPSQDSSTFEKMNENQGLLRRDTKDAEKNTKDLLKKLKQEAGLNKDKKS